MPDVFTKAKRSQVMAAVRSRGNKDTELKLVAILRAAHITGWRRHLPLPGRPDFAFPHQRLAIFVDGCFWHGCRRHCRMPKSRTHFWVPKISRNKRRDLKVRRLLRAKGWRVFRVWEHSLRNPGRIALNIQTALASKPRKR
ncbi:MAG: very short patch repair endonuclease [Limisphaerales bacterium]